ncbi:MAG TPA: glycosyl hydrolase, partial [Polyangiaceae bacterium]|nr:glycosyl hydrolase [Polyangiaceae bacterium]
MRSPSISVLVILLGVGCVQACSESSKGEDQSGVGGGSSNGGSAPRNTSSAQSTGVNSAQGGNANVGTTPTNGGRVAASQASTAIGGDFGATGGVGADAGGSSSSGGSVLGSLSRTSTSGGTKERTSARGGASQAGGTSVRGGATSDGGTPTTASSRSTGGATSTGGKNVCGTAAEDASVALSCPAGQVIDSVVFASYGTPTGTCGGFLVGSCEATSSKATVESLCTRRRSCTVPATNSAFGDPCSRTTKQLAVEATCAEGTPDVTPETPYKGVANSPASQIAALDATWCYNWGTTPKSTDCADPYFVPMVWGGGDVAAAIKAIGNAGYTTVLGFNEPNKKDQSNMTVADAVALWPTLTSNPNIRVGSPAVS